METYYHPHDLTRFADMGKGNLELWDKFMQYYSAVFADGALTEREKALIALGVAHAVQCPYCIDAYSQACLEKGSNAEEMTEALIVNPYSIEETAEVIRVALEMTRAERCERHGALLARVQQHDAAAWSQSFLEHVKRARMSQEKWSKVQE